MADEGATMSEGGLTFNRGAVRPVECLKAGWQMIRADYWLFFAITLVGILLANVGFGLLMGPMMCGLYLCLLRREAGRPVSFDMLFQGFNYFVQSLIATLIMVLPSLVLVGVFYGVVIVAMVVTGVTMAGQPPDQAPDPTLFLVFMVGFLVGLIVVLLIAMFLAILFLFTYHLIVDRGLSAVAAVRTSARAVLANFGGILGLVLLSSLLVSVGVLACYVGAYFVMPVHTAAVVAAYRKVFPA